MSKILIPATSAEDWKQFLAQPDKHWKTGYSARAIAHCWQDADGIPEPVRNVLQQTQGLEGLETLIAIPEHQVPLPGGSTASQNDVWVLARTATDLVSIAVEGKVSESFDRTIKEWGPDSSNGKRVRFNYLCSILGFASKPPDNIRYQLMHRTASAIIEAKRFHARHAVMLIHSFSQSEEWFADYENFLSLYGVGAEMNKTVSVGVVSGVQLHFSWVRGEEKYLLA